MIRTSLVLLSFTFLFASAQIFDWSGRWEVWDTLPRNASFKLKQCCVPEEVIMTQHGKNNGLVDVVITFTEEGRKNCPEIKSNRVFLHDLDSKFGLIDDVNQFSPLFGARALFRPNNNTVEFNPGTYGNCMWFLGNERSTVTNSSAPHRAFSWEGSWDFDFHYPVVEDVYCCEPEYPVYIEEDRRRNKITYDLLVTDPKCPTEYIGLTHFELNVDGGGFFDQTGGKGFLLPNRTLLIEWGLCVTGLKKVSDKPSGTPLEAFDDRIFIE